MTGFDQATAVRRRPAAAASATAAYDVDLDPAWQIAGKPNGGYLLALLARAAVDAATADHPHPVAVAAQFVAAPAAGPAVVDVEVVREGRSVSQVRAVLTASGQRRVEALVTLGRLTPAAEPWWQDVPMPELPALSECVRAPGPTPPFPVPLLDVVEEWLDPASAGFGVGRPSGAGELRAWVRLADGRDPDPLSLLLAVDCLPPATFDLGVVGSWVPTLQLTAYVHGLPAPGPLRVRQRIRSVGAGQVDEVCDVWDDAGRLVATGHQLAAIRLPEGVRPAPRR